MIQALVHSLKIVTIVATAVLVAFGGRSFFDYYTAKEADPRLGQPYIVQITEEDTADTLAERFSEDGLIRSELVFTTEMRLTSDILQPGAYTLRYGMSVREIIDVITVAASDEEGGEQTAQEIIEITIPEGRRIEEIAEYFADLGLDADYDDFIAALENISTRRYDFLDDLPEDASLEGYLFPNTYNLTTNSIPEDLIYYMLDTFDQQFTPEMRERAAELGLTIHEVVTLASLVERESAEEEDRRLVARVYLNRLNIGMKLDADPTVSYALGTPDDWWPELQPNQQYSPEVENNPYNTYTNETMPPGPICNPGLDAILAVLYPADGDYLYFVAKNDGSGTHAFAVTPEEHQENIDRYQNGGGD